MLIPVRCFTCGKVLADKYAAYERMCAAQADEPDPDGKADVVDFFFEETPKGAILDTLGLTRICCRRHMLTCVRLIDII